MGGHVIVSYEVVLRRISCRMGNRRMQLHTAGYRRHTVIQFSNPATRPEWPGEEAIHIAQCCRTTSG